MRGQAAILAIIFLFVLLFVVYIGYSVFHRPVTETIGTIENTATDKTPSSIFDKIDLSWAIWPIVLIIFGFLAAFAYIFHRRREYAPGSVIG